MEEVEERKREKEQTIIKTFSFSLMVKSPINFFWNLL